MRREIEDAERIVIKLGTFILTQEDGGLASARLRSLVGQCVRLIEAGKRVIIVSSGAVGLGRNQLGLDAVTDTTAKQACAAVGQSLLMKEYQRLFARHGLTTAQLLVTAGDFSDRRRYLNLRETFERLLSFGVVPVVNENDSVSAAELQEDTRTHSFGDNDVLSALVASKLAADLLLILTNVEGIYDSNPHQNPDARMIDRLEDFEQVKRLSLNESSPYGRGGVRSKIEAARLASLGGVPTVIASGLRPNAILGCRGTLVPARVGLPGRKQWIGLSSGFQGVIQINAGATKALINDHASLLPSGIVGVEGEFSANDVVSVETVDGREIGRGITYLSSADVRTVQGCHSREIANRLPNASHREVIHRDHLVIFGEGAS